MHFRTELYKMFKSLVWTAKLQASKWRISMLWKWDLCRSKGELSLTAVCRAWWLSQFTKNRPTKISSIKSMLAESSNIEWELLTYQYRPRHVQHIERTFNWKLLSQSTNDCRRSYDREELSIAICNCHNLWYKERNKWYDRSDYSKYYNNYITIIN